ncbi:MAG: hypothetical protein ACQKBY_07520 [Verrucomicrobiales bacterium]
MPQTLPPSFQKLPCLLAISLLSASYASATVLRVEMRQYDYTPVAIGGYVDTVANTFTIDTWNLNTQLDIPATLPLPLQAYEIGTGITAYDIPDHWDGSAGGAFGFGVTWGFSSAVPNNGIDWTHNDTNLSTSYGFGIGASLASGNIVNWGTSGIWGYHFVPFRTSGSSASLGLSHVDVQVIPEPSASLLSLLAIMPAAFLRRRPSSSRKND